MALTKISRSLLDTGVSDSSDATAITIDSSEKVGIGETSPLGTLHVKTADSGASADSGADELVLENSGDAGITILSGTSNSGSIRFGDSADNDNGIIIYNHDSSPYMRFFVDASEKMRISSSGNLTTSDSLGVGTGTTAPNSRLQIKKDGTGNYANQTFSNSDSTAGITFGVAGSGTGNYLANNAFLLNTGASNFIFGSNDAEKMRITNDSSYANLCIGRTGTIGDASVNLHLTTGGWAIGEGTAGNTTAGSYRRAYYAPANDGLYYWNGSNQAYLTSAGVWTDASDERLKKDIVDIPYGLDAVKLLKPRKYKMKANDLEQVGFIAQEVKDIIPEVAELTTVEHSDKENQDQYGLSYGHLTAVLTKAIQELSAKVEELESKINE